MERLKIAVIGTGNRAGAHLATIPKLTDIYCLAAVCDINEERLKPVAERHNVPSYTDAEKMLATEKPDVVLIAVGGIGHHTIAKIAAEYGAHILTETPIASTLPCTDLMINAAKEHKVKLEVSENVWRWPHERAKRYIVDAGLIGEVTFAHLWYSSYHGNNAIRVLIKSEAKRVIGFTPGRTAPGVPSVIGIIEFESGASAIDQSPTQRQRAYWEIDGCIGAIVGNELQLYDGQEIKKYPIQTITGEVEGKRTIIESRVDTSPPVIWENPLAKYGLTDADDVARAAAHYSIYRAVVEDIEPEYGAENARKDMEILIAIRESALKGNIPIEIPLTEITEYERGIHESYRNRYGHEPLEIGRKEARTAY